MENKRVPLVNRNSKGVKIAYDGDGETPDKKWLLMGRGSSRNGNRVVAYPIDPHFID